MAQTRIHHYLRQSILLLNSSYCSTLRYRNSDTGPIKIQFLVIFNPLFPAFWTNIGVFWIFNGESSGNQALQGTNKGYAYVVPIEETTEEKYHTSLKV